MTKAVILASGGITSTVAAAIGREQYEPALLHVIWGHRAAEKEQAAFEHIAASLKIEQTRTAELTSHGLFASNPRVNKRLIPDQQQAPACFAMGLLPAMLGIAASWADGIGASRIILGICEDHGVSGVCLSEIYPDYKREFVQTFNLMLHHARHNEGELMVEAPLLELTRAEVIKLADLMHVPLEQTWSCYLGNENPCCHCIGCKSRADGFLQAGIPDHSILNELHAAH